MRANYKELGLLILFLGMGAVMFSSLVYVFENDDDSSSFTTMLDAYWWAFITMTTVGYGDVYPITGKGRVNSVTWWTRTFIVLEVLRVHYSL